jgi:Protein of unknown function (DUF559)
MATLATRQHGVVARSQLLERGFGSRGIERRLRDGRLHALHRGVYAVGHPLVVQRGHWIAAVLACGEEALLSHLSATTLWGLVRPRSPIDVTSSSGRSGRRAIRFHQGKVGPDERAIRDRIPTTTVARTLFDLAEAIDAQRLERAWEEADRLNLLELRAVQRVCDRNPGRRALPPIRRLLADTRIVTGTRSRLEDRFAAFCRTYQLPPRATNVDVLGSEVDVLWPAARLIVELDSWEFHRHRAAFQRDRARDTRLLVAGYRTIRVTHERLDTEAPTLATEINQLLGQ